MKLQKNQVVELEIIDMSVEGMGIGKVDAYPIFVKDALCGEKVKVKLIKLKSKFGIGRLIEVLEPSSHRVKPRCEVARACGGCQLQHLDYHEQLVFKKTSVVNNLKRIGQFHEVEVRDVIGMQKPWVYRNKSQFPVGIDKDGQFVSGFYQKGSHQIVPTKTCYIGSEVSDLVRETVLDWLEGLAQWTHFQDINKKTLDKRYGKRYEQRQPDIRDYRQSKVYDESTHEGLLRHIIVREARNTGRLMVCLVCTSPHLPWKERLIQKLQKIDGFTSLMLNINQRKDNVILGDQSICLWGEKVLEDTLFDLKFRIHIESFYQVNTNQMQQLYIQALEAANIQEDDVVWDVYCGIGTMSLLFARHAKWVYGIEVVEEAVINAKENAKLNQIDNVSFIVGGAEDILPIIQKDQEKKPSVIVVDPPRKGCDRQVLEVLLKMGAKKIVYVSCDSATLSRDLRVLVDGGYDLEYVQPVDMFCHTVGVETVCLLSRIEKSNKIKVKIDLDKEDLTSSELKQLIKK